MKKTALERFEEKYAPDPNTGCWLWFGASNRRGYGKLFYRGAMKYAHRISYEWAHGPIPESLEVDHLCRVTSCVNPDHLELVTHRENILRGESPAANQARQTHCVNGHPLSGDNLYIYKNSKRGCFICRRAHSTAYNRKKARS